MHFLEKNDQKKYIIMEKELRKRLILFMEMNDLSVNSLAKVIKVQVRTLNNQINSNTTIPATVIMGVLKEYKELSSDWLLRGEGSIYIDDGVTMNDITKKYNENIKKANEVLNLNIPTIEEHNKQNEDVTIQNEETIRRQQREIDGLYERIDELKYTISELKKENAPTDIVHTA